MLKYLQVLTKMYLCICKFQHSLFYYQIQLTPPYGIEHVKSRWTLKVCLWGKEIPIEKEHWQLYFSLVIVHLGASS